MARVAGPFLSIAASGTIADTLTASNWKGLPYIRMWFKPQNPQTTNQMIQRNKFAASVNGWQAQTSQVKLAWDIKASTYQVSGFNYFVQQYLMQNSYITNVMPVIPGE